MTWRPKSSWAHPRSRGENRCCSLVSPSLRWLIPAHAGKTGKVVRWTGPKGAHPRSRGENRNVARAGHGATGSSPLTRGKLQEPSADLAQSGLIPAHAGKTRSRSWRSSARPAHPRSRGENAVVSLEQLAPAGSSPLTRGKLRRAPVLRSPSGLIPAHAGKTVLRAQSGVSPRAHPRSRGENLPDRDAATAIAGSSPLTRGKQGELAGTTVGGGLIPAHAGKTAAEGGPA